MSIRETIRTPRILVVEDDPDAADLERECLEDVGYAVDIANSAEQAEGIVSNSFFDLIVADDRLKHESGSHFLAECNEKIPGLGAILVTGYADLDLALRAMRTGVLDILQKPVRRAELVDTVRRVLADSALTREARFHRWEAARHEKFSEIIGNSPALREVMETVRKVMGTDAPVLIRGESGTGKELIARAVHQGGARRSKPFVAVNAGAMAETLLESTLFGSKRGSFTDAKTDQIGLFQAAQGGTLFLDEIGETSAGVQVRLLRVLQEKEILRVGDTKPIPVDVRIIAATNRDLKAAIAGDRFRKDLYYRLSVVNVNLPPLRERTDDIAPLARHLIDKHARDLGKQIRRIEPAALEKLYRYAWPGNIRELDNVLQRAVILADGDAIGPELLVLEPPDPNDPLAPVLDLGFREAVIEFERQYFRHVLRRARNNKSRAAVMAGLERTVLHAHLKKIGEPDEDS